ncbi:hypothetical protein ABIB82_000578 [Bradyrhizobium sp. i1.8.4]
MAPRAGATMRPVCQQKQQSRLLIPAPRYFALPSSISVRVIR